MYVTLFGRPCIQKHIFLKCGICAVIARHPIVGLLYKTIWKKNYILEKKRLDILL